MNFEIQCGHIIGELPEGGAQLCTYPFGHPGECGEQGRCCENGFFGDGHNCRKQPK